MKTVIIIRSGEDTILVKCPYDRISVDRIKNLKGTWHSPTGTWSVDVRSREAVERLLLARYGVTEGEIPAVDISLRVPEDHLASQRTFGIAGRTLIDRVGRDFKVRTYDNVVIAGDWPFKSSGGSVKYPCIGSHPEFTAEIRDLPAVLFKDDTGKLNGLQYEVIRRSVSEVGLQKQMRMDKARKAIDVLSDEEVTDLMKYLQTKNIGIAGLETPSNAVSEVSKAADPSC